MKHPSYSNYHSPNFDAKEREEKLNQALKMLEGYEFDAFVVRGISGIAFGSILAYIMGKRLVIVRKPDEDSHGQCVENWQAGDRIIYLDDFICSGDTLREMHKALSAIKWSYNKVSDVESWPFESANYVTINYHLTVVGCYQYSKDPRYAFLDASHLTSYGINSIEPVESPYQLFL